MNLNVFTKSDGLPAIDVGEQIRVGADHDGIFLSTVGPNYVTGDGTTVSTCITLSPTQARALTAALTTAATAVEKV